MHTIQVRARVRPLRFGALIGSNTKRSDLTVLLHVLSLTWAGRYMPMIRISDPLSEGDLRHIRSQGVDFVWGVGIDHANATKAVTDNLRTIGYLPLSNNLEDFFESIVRPIPAGSPVQRFLKENPVADASRITVWEISTQSPLFLFFSFAFGFHSSDILEFAVNRLRAEKRIVGRSLSTRMRQSGS